MLPYPKNLQSKIMDLPHLAKLQFQDLRLWIVIVLIPNPKSQIQNCYPPAIAGIMLSSSRSPIVVFMPSR